MLKKNLKNQKGFTLIEIIAVLVILGILAAVAVPKYMDMQGQAATKALDGAVATGVSTVTMQYARLALSHGRQPTVTETATAAGLPANSPSNSDFTYSFAPSGTTGVQVTTQWADSARASGGSISKIRTITLN